MAGNDDGEWIVVVGHPNSPGCSRTSDGVGDIAIRAGFSVRYPLQLTPDGFLKIGSLDIERKIEVGPLSLKVFRELIDSFLACIRVGNRTLGNRIPKLNRSQTPVGDSEGEWTHGAVHDCVMHGARVTQRTRTAQGR